MDDEEAEVRRKGWCDVVPSTCEVLKPDLGLRIVGPSVYQCDLRRGFVRGKELATDGQ